MVFREKNRCSGFRYPFTPRGDTVDDFHGVMVHDPYRWLEEEGASETREWVTAQEKLAEEFFENCPGKARIIERLKEICNYTRYGLVRKRGGTYFFSKNDGLQPQSVLYKSVNPESEPVAVLDPNSWTPDGTVTYTQSVITADGRLIAYCVSASGSDRTSIRIRDVETMLDFAEELHWCKFAGIAWKSDNSGFYYNRFPEPGTVPPEDECNYSKVYWHTLNTPQSEDLLVFSLEDKEITLSPAITDDGRYLVIMGFKGTDRENIIYVKDLSVPGKEWEGFVPVVEKFEAGYLLCGNEGSRLFFMTTQDAQRGRVIEIDLQSPGRTVSLIDEHPTDVFEYLCYACGKFFAVFLHDAHNIIRIYDRRGHFLSDVGLPGFGSVCGISSSQSDQEIFFSYSSFFQPVMILKYDVKENMTEHFFVPEFRFDPDDYTSEQVFFKSKDGTDVPMFVSARKGTVLDGRNPAVLYGYGGFDISLKPSFSVLQLYWLETGGIWATANTRGGGEYGEKWHHAGKLEKKQNVFDDFIAAAEFLVSEKYTSPSRLALSGGSNGGLLVAACMIQRPDLCRAVLCGVPVIDMLRYHRFTVGRFWICEYGNAENSPKEFEYLFNYSPLHNVSDETDYPAVLILTADHDDRVYPAHAFKFAATLQNSSGLTKPVLLRIERKAGHGQGKPLMKSLIESADKILFLNSVLSSTREPDGTALAKSSESP